MRKIMLYILLQCGVLILFAQGTAQLYVHAPVLAPDDTLVLYLQKERITEPFRNPFQSIEATNVKGAYSFEIDLSSDWTWIGMNLSYERTGSINVHSILKEMLLEVGDSVHIYLKPKEGVFQAFEEGYNGIIPRVVERWDANFAGKGAEKYEVLWKIKLLNETNRRTQLINQTGEDFGINILKVRTQVKVESMAVLEKYNSLLNSRICTLVKAQVLGQLGNEFGKVLKSLNRSSKNKGNPVIRQYWGAYLKETRESIANADENYIYAPMYIDYLVEYSWLVFLDQYQRGENSVVQEWCEIIKGLFPPSAIRDRIIANALLKRFPNNPDKDLLDDAFASMKDTLSLSKIRPLRNLLEGAKAYAFSLPDVDGKYHRLEDFKGKVVFMDFWFATCAACHAYMRNVLSPIQEMYKDNPNVVFITVSIDDLKTFKMMLAKDNYLPKEGVHLYTDGQYWKHAIIQHYQIRGYPHPLLIGKDGNLLSEKMELKKINDLKRAIDLALME